MFYKLLSDVGVIGLVIGLLVFTIALVFLFRGIMSNSSAKIQANQEPIDGLEKKHWAVDINKYGGVISRMGFILSLGFVFLAFEMPTFEEQQIVDLGTLEVEVEEQIEIPPTEQKPPPPPKVTLPEIVEVPDEEEIEEEIEVELDVEVDEETVVEAVVEVEEPEEEEPVDQVFTIVEEQATPVGGYEAFYKYIQKNLEYPRQAKRMNVQGKVFLEFIVDKDGSITNVNVVRGIGAGCDEEAKRILMESPKWKPAKQRGRAVKQKMTFPINFRLQ
jgi:protein TonB